MKKSKLSLGLVTALVAASGMTACANVTSSKTAVVTFTGYDGQTVDVITDDVYKDYLNSSSGISKFYNAMLEVLIRYEFKSEDSVLSKNKDNKIKSYTEIETEAKSELDGYKTKAKENAKANGTKYDDEWESILEENGVEDSKEFLQKLIYKIEKEEVEDWYFRDNETSLLKEYIGIEEGAVPAKYPYHIRHILTSLSGGGSDFYNGTISESEARSLYTVVKALRDGRDTFGEVARTQSGDTGSAAKYGSVGIMDTSTSFVNEFKLGIYAYDAIYSGRDVAVKDGLGLTSEVAAKLGGLVKVPYAAFEALNEYKDTVTDTSGHQVNDGNSAYYPRNIMYNKYLNHHDVFVITNASTNAESVDGSELGEFDTSIKAAAVGQCGFHAVEGLTNGNELVLTDEAGRPIVGVRSEHGIHFMVIEKSINDSGLETYYSTTVPNTLEAVDHSTYVGYINTTDLSSYRERAEDLQDTIKSFDSTYDYRLFTYFMSEEGENIEFNTDLDIDLSSVVTDYVARQQEYSVWNTAKNLNDSWRTYLELIDSQNKNRNSKRLVSEMCALHFKDASNSKLFKEGGLCYYAK